VIAAWQRAAEVRALPLMEDAVEVGER